MLRQIAIADAYGAGFEFSSQEKIDNHNDLTRYMAHDLTGSCGKYTDDTQMNIALAELIASGESWTPETVANHFVDTFNRDPRGGYSKRFRAVLDECSSGQDLLKSIKPESTRNGAAMRSPVIAYLGNEEAIRSHCELQASVTHNTPIATQSSQAVALAAYFGLSQTGTVAEIPSFLKSHGVNIWNYEWQGESTVQAYDACSAALTCLLNCRQLSSLIIECVALGGDTDTVAAIAVGIAACYTEYEKDIPEKLLDSLDEVTYGVAFLDDLNNQLHTSLTSNQAQD